MPAAHRSITYEKLREVTDAMFAATKDDLLGLETEWAVHPVADPVTRPDLGRLLTLADSPLPEAGRVTVEPGGQIELSSAPQPSVSDAIRAVDTDAAVLEQRLSRLGLRGESRAVDVRDPVRILDQPRYRAMNEHFDRQGVAGRWMMTNTSSVQVNISNDPADPLGRWRVLNLTSPVLIAMFANSRAVDASGATWESARQGIWWNIDPTRTRPVPMSDDPSGSWLRYALDALVFFIPTEGPGRPGGAGVSESMTFRQWMHRGHELGWPTTDDFRYHLTTLFPPIRPRGWMELRVLDALPRAERAAAALAVATIGQAGVRAELHERLPDTSDLWLDAARHGLRHPRLAEAATILSSVLSAYAPEVADTREHVDLLDSFLERFTARHLAPGSRAWLPLPIDLTGAGVRRSPSTPPTTTLVTAPGLACTT
ncbi:glutamate-cysteine ligase family protein [Streptomyces sp. NBC_00490]|uniref:glutamate-cysteine ligase family protein n=1 Tax=Streptomyces sp. NBC_00490 TaxID=2903657 RepID=UPI002E1700DF